MGFRPGLSTVDAVATFVDDVGLNSNNKFLTVATFIDLKKAFDTLDHNIVLRRLAKAKVHPSSMKWFKSYLTNR